MSGKYTPLEHYLRDLLAIKQGVNFPFGQIERTLNDKLLLSAAQHWLWWSNETEGSYVQDHAWVDAGRKVERVNSFGSADASFKRC